MGMERWCVQWWFCIGKHPFPSHGSGGMLPNIEMRCIVPLFVEVIIGFRIHKFKLRDYVYLQQIMQTILDDFSMCFFCVQILLPFGMLLLQGREGQTWKDHVCKRTLCHFPIWLAKLTHHQ